MPSNRLLLASRRFGLAGADQTDSAAWNKTPSACRRPMARASTDQLRRRGAHLSIAAPDFLRCAHGYPVSPPGLPAFR